MKLEVGTSFRPPFGDLLDDRVLLRSSNHALNLIQRLCELCGRNSLILPIESSYTRPQKLPSCDCRLVVMAFRCPVSVIPSEGRLQE